MNNVAGFDLASESIAYCVMNQTGQMVKQGKVSWDVPVLKRLVETYQLETVAYESSVEAYRLRPILDRLCVNSYPFHAANFAPVWQTKRKTDKIDAKKIARGLCGKVLPPPVVLPGAADERLRFLVNEREFHLRSINRCLNRVRNLARKSGTRLPRSRLTNTLAWWEDVENALPAEDRGATRRLSYQAVLAWQCITDIETELPAVVAAAGHEKRAARLKTIPGVGDIIAFTLLAYLGNGSRFPNGRHFSSYCGLTPIVSATGKSHRLGHITAEGPPILRRLLIQAAHVAVQTKAFAKTPMYAWYKQVRRRVGSKKATVALARRLAKVAYAVVNDDTDFRP